MSSKFLPDILDAIKGLSHILASSAVAGKGRVRLTMNVHTYLLNDTIVPCFEVTSNRSCEVDEQTVCYLFNELDQATKYYELQVQGLF